MNVESLATLHGGDRHSLGALTDRTVVVVGAGSIAEGWGNGKACAVAYAQAGARVVCIDRVHANAAAVAAEIDNAQGQALALEADALDEQAMERALARAVETFGTLDVLHNNVGFGGTAGTPDRLSLADWNQEIAVNLTTAFLGIRLAVPYMRKASGGAITNTSSLLSTRFLRQPNVAYSAAKAGVEAMTRACAAAYGKDNIRVNCLRIGFSETPLVRESLRARNLSPELEELEMDKSRAKVPLRREHTDPFEVAAAAVFLASDAARGITGAILNVDGGLECAPI